MVKHLLAYIAVVILMIISGQPVWAQQGEYLRIIHLNVGQGDATLVIGPNNTTILIDAGYAGQASKAIIPALRALGVAHLDTIIATHFHSDHIAGFTRLSGFTSSETQIFDRGNCEGESSCHPVPLLTTASGRKTIYAKYKEALLGTYHRVTAATGDIQLGMGAKLEFIGAGGDVWGRELVAGGQADENAQSVSMLITYGAFKYLIGGDVTGGGNNTINVEANIAAVVGDVDVLQSNHHGSPASNSQHFLEVVSPEIAIISVGDGNSHHLPKRSVLNRFRTLRTTHDFKYLFMTNEGNIGGTVLDNGDLIDAGLIESDREFIAIAIEHISLFATPDYYIINGVIMPAGG